MTEKPNPPLEGGGSGNGRRVKRLPPYSRPSPPSNSHPIRANLTGSDSVALACGMVANGNSPVLKLCRRLMGAGVDPARSLLCYRADVLCLTVHTIAEGAALEINGEGHGLKPARQPGAGSPMRRHGKNDPAEGGSA